MDSHDDTESTSSDNNTLHRVPTIVYAVSLEEILSFAQEHEKSGTPYVVTGLPLGDGDHSQSPISQSSEWLENIYRLRANNQVDAHSDEADAYADRTCLPCPMEWSNWLQTSYIVPGFLTPGGSRDVLPAPVVQDRCQLQVSGPVVVSRFMDNPDSTFTQDLLCLGDTESSRRWFVTPASDYANVLAHLQKLGGSDGIQGRTFDAEEFSDAPFTVYVHEQGAGDLLVVPPRCFSQQINEGVTASLRWHRITLDGLKAFIYHDQYLKQRLCIPSKYPVKQIIHDNIQSRAREIDHLIKTEPNDHEAIVAGCGGLADMLVLFEEILTSSFCDDDESVPTLDTATPPQFCAFCGGELFRSVFSCAGHCGRSQNRPEEEVTICASCYVDGRTCECGVMAPRRLQQLTGLLKFRDDVRGLLSNVMGDDLHQVFPQGETEFSDGVYGVFAAAMALCRTRESTVGEVRTCTLRTKPSHRVPEFGVISCDGCHAKRCYKHILTTYSVHSSTALIINHMNHSSDTWHGFHQVFKDRFAKEYTQLKLAAKYGRWCPLDHRLAYYASEFTPTSPVNKAMRPGFFDPVVSDSEQAQKSGVTGQGGNPGPPPTTSSTAGTLNSEASSSRPRPITRRVASQDLGPSTSHKRSLSPQETELITQKRSRFTSNTRTHTKTRGTAKGGSSRTTAGKKRAAKGKGKENPAGVSRRSKRIISSEESTSDSDRSPPLARPGPRRAITPPSGPSSVKIYRETRRSQEEPDQPSSPLHQPLAYFDPDIDIVEGEPPRDNFQSAWGNLLEAHTVSSRNTNGRESNDVLLNTPTNQPPPVSDTFPSLPVTPEPGSVDPQSTEPRGGNAPDHHALRNGRASWLGRVIGQETRGGSHLRSAPHHVGVPSSATTPHELQYPTARGQSHSVGFRRIPIDNQRISILSRSPSIDSNSSTASTHRRGVQPVFARRSATPNTATSNLPAAGQVLPPIPQRRPETSDSHVGPAHTGPRPAGTRALGDSVSMENLDSYIKIMEASREHWEAQRRSDQS